MEEKVIQISGSITVDELATALGVSVTHLIGELFKNGIMATINQRLDAETAQIMTEELGFKNVRFEKKENSAKIPGIKRELSKDAKLRPPVVAVMGHVDHGKTTLLDTLLKKKTVDDEAGGITQHISAYQMEYKDRKITFLDTPGHEAFAAIRQHGAMLTDIVVIVVAADDGVKPQTAEAIKFAEAANAKIIVAINKIDKDGANIERTKAQLATDFSLNPEEWGGDTIMVPISAKTGQNVEQLLDMILLTADIDELKADENIPAEGLVIESHMEVGKGSVVNLLVTGGELKVGEFIVAGKTYAKVRTMLDWKNKPKGKATPSTPVVVTGFKDLPNFGDKFEESYDLATQLINRLTPGDENIYYMKRMQLYNLVQLKKWPEAVEAGKSFFDTMIPKGSARESRDYTDYGQALLEVGNGAEAISAFEAALKLNPNNFDLIRYMGDSYAETEDYVNAAAYYQRLYDSGNCKANDIFYLSRK